MAQPNVEFPLSKKYFQAFNFQLEYWFINYLLKFLFFLNFILLELFYFQLEYFFINLLKFHHFILLG